MKGLKKLCQTPFQKVVTIKRNFQKNNQWYAYGCKVNHFTYSARIVETESGNFLSVCLYGARDESRKRNVQLPIIERHFVSTDGDIGSEKFDKDFLSQIGNFIVSTTCFEGWERSSAVYEIAREWYPNRYCAINDADDVILDFAKNNGIYDDVKKIYIPTKDYVSGLCWLAGFQSYIKQIKKSEAKERREQRVLNRMQQVPEDAPEEFAKWVSDELFSTSAWLYKFKGRVAEGVCGGCNERAVIQGVKNHKKGICPHCGRPIQFISIKNADRICDYNFNTTFIERLSENKFINRYFSITKTYFNLDDKASSRIRIKEYGREFFCVKGKTIEKVDQYKASYDFYRGGIPRWERIPPRYSVSNPGATCTTNILEITQALAEQGIDKLKNMDLRPLFRICWDNNPIRLFNKATAIPALESIAKMGLERLAEDIAGSPNALIDFCELATGSPAKMLGVDKIVLKKFVEINITLNQYIFWKDAGLTLNDFSEFVQLIEVCTPYLFPLQNILQRWDGIRLGTMVRYMKKQRERFEYSSYDVAIYWRDYLGMINPEEAAKNRNLLYPEDVKKEHDRLMVLQETLKSKAMSENLKLRAEMLENLTFSDDDYIIFPLHSPEEFLDESNVLNHCVKTYTKQCANGETNIFGLRKVDKPGRPYFTVNINNKGGLIQNRGKNNCAPPKEVKKFVDKWLKIVEKKLKTISLDPKAVLNQIKVKIGA